MDPAQDPGFAAGAELEGERVTLDYLRAYRLALELRCAGLDAEQLTRRSVPPSHQRGNDSTRRAAVWDYPDLAPWPEPVRPWLRAAVGLPGPDPRVAEPGRA